MPTVVTNVLEKVIRDFLNTVEISSVRLIESAISNQCRPAKSEVKGPVQRLLESGFCKLHQN